MIKHIAMFQFSDFKTEKEKEEYRQRLTLAFKGLEHKIPEIKSLQIGFDELHSDDSFDFIVNVDLNNLTDLPIYANHPEHLKAAKVVRERATNRKVIDYKF